MKTLLILIALAGLPLLSAQAADYRVGFAGDAACTHTSLQAAIDDAIANPLPAGSVREIILSEGTFSLNAAVTISNSPNDLVIRGGQPDCSSNIPFPPLDATIVQVTEAGQRAFTIVHAASGQRKITFRSLTMLSLQQGPTQGGLIHSTGEVLLSLEDRLELRNGKATLGGAVYLQGSLGRQALLRIGASNGNLSRPALRSNSAERGGAIYCGFNASVRLEFVWISSNQADLFGGAIYASPCPGGVVLEPFDRPLMASPMILFSQNTAGNPGSGIEGRGGAIHIDGTTLESTFGPDRLLPTHPVRFSLNQADYGGAIHATGSSLQTRIELDTPSFSSNTARFRGGAMYLSGRVEAHLYSSETERCWNDFDAEFRVPSCHFYRNNKTLTSGLLGNGGVFYLDNAGGPSGWNPSLLVERAHFTGNYDTYSMIALAMPGSSIGFHSSTFLENVGNEVTVNYLVVANSVESFQFRHNTVGVNPHTNILLAGGTTHAEIHGSIIWSPGSLPWTRTSTDASISWGGCALVNSLANFPQVPDRPWTDDPMLRDDLTLAANSPAIDRCGAGHLGTIDGDELDLRLRPRGNLISGPASTPVDIGAFEFYDAVFADRFQ